MIPVADAFCENFYARLFQEAPGVTSLFPVAMENQRDQLVLMLASAVDLLDALPECASFCRACGARHQKYGAQAEQFAFVGSLMRSELSKVHDPAFTPEELAAWGKFIDAVAKEMLNGFVGTAGTQSQG